MIEYFLSEKETKMLGNCLENVRKSTPLVHNITNYVTVNDVANVLLACGGSPIMSDEPDDVADITSICGGLNINIGTLNKQSIEAMFIAGAKANELGHPVLLDPVGAGASALRTNTAVAIMEKIKLDVIRGKASNDLLDGSTERNLLPHQMLQNTANIIVQHRIADNIVRGILHVTVDVLDQKSDLIQLHAGAKHIDNENMRHLINIIFFQAAIGNPATLGPVL